MLALLASASAACAVAPVTPVDETPLAFPSWLPLPSSLRRDEALERAAARLCTREGDSVIDDEIRVAGPVLDGAVVGLRTADRDEMSVQAPPLVDALGADRIGVVERTDARGAPCIALVAAHHEIDVVTHPAAIASPPLPDAPLVFDLRLPVDVTAALYVTGPDGFVDRVSLAPDARTHVAHVALPFRVEGRHVAEVVVDRVDARSGVARGAPEVAVLWPFLVGRAKDAPAPIVLFPDEGHDDVALTHRAEALVQRLRNEQLIDPFKVSPLLVTLATERAHDLAAQDRLGHRAPSGGTVVEQLRARFPDDPRARFSRVSEVQARGSTLADAWNALLDSPGHRYELVQRGTTHCGVAVARGRDALGRNVVTMVALLARRAPQRDVDTVRTTLLQRFNEARGARGLEPLAVNRALDELAQRLSRAMAEAGSVDEDRLGDPIAQLALQADPSLSKVQAIVARLDDPLLMHADGALLDIDTSRVGFGAVLRDGEGAFYVVVLAAEGG